MTFIIGFHCFDGLVLCADSEENDSVNKTYVDKLWCEKIGGEPGVCFGGSGEAIAIDKFKSKLLSILPSGSNDAAKVELSVEKLLDYTFKRYGDGWDVLLGHVERGAHRTYLYRTHGNQVLRPIDSGRFVCIGMDTSLAMFLLGNVFDSFMGVEECLRIGVWVTALMKIHTADVSGPTMAFSYKHGQTE